eukprot:7381481-Prymnesium_polylepis.1
MTSSCFCALLPFQQPRAHAHPPLTHAPSQHRTHARPRVALVVSRPHVSPMCPVRVIACRTNTHRVSLSHIRSNQGSSFANEDALGTRFERSTKQ